MSAFGKLLEAGNKKRAELDWDHAPEEQGDDRDELLEAAKNYDGKIITEIWYNDRILELAEEDGYEVADEDFYGLV